MKGKKLVQKRFMIAMLLAGSGLQACADGNVGLNNPSHLITNIAVPNVTNPAFNFDIAYVEDGKFYLTDRNNKAIDVVDTSTNKLIAQIPGEYAGIGKNSTKSGPDGIVGITGTHTIYVGDVNSVKVVDTDAQQVIKTIPISGAGNRVDEGCYDPDDHLVLIASPGDSPPFATFISTQTQRPVSTLTFPGSSGLEACAYDAKSKNFMINNDGTASNPLGELDTIAASSVVAGTPVVSARFPLGKCSPTGLVLGPNNDVMVGCSPPAGDPLITLIFDRTSGALQATIPFGGVDQIAYDPASNRYFLPARNWVPGGIAADSGFSAQMGVIDGASRTLLYTVAAGKGSHSVAIDSTTHRVNVPFQAGSPAFPNGGISVFATK
jgi:hypothetical protein